MAHLVFNAQNAVASADDTIPGWETPLTVSLGWDNPTYTARIRVPRNNPVVSITSNVTGSWLGWSPSSISTPGTSSVMINATQNTAGSNSPRSATLTATYQDGTTSVLSITQRGNPAVDMDGTIVTNLSFPSGANRAVLDIWYQEYPGSVTYGGFKSGQDLYTVVYYDGDENVGQTTYTAPSVNASSISYVISQGGDIINGEIIATYRWNGADNGYT